MQAYIKSIPRSFESRFILLTCILRLRVLPNVPYPLIANLILTHWPEHVLRLASIHLPAGEIQEGWLREMGKDWMARWLQEVYESDEREERYAWVLAKERRSEDVCNILSVTGLAVLGYEVVDEREIQLQLRWRRERDWRAGSVPLETMAGTADDADGALRVPSVSLLDLRGGTQEWEEKRNRFVREVAHPCWKSFEDQIEEVKRVEEALKEEGCERYEYAR